MKTWKDYLDVMNSQGKAAGWTFAKKHFPKDSIDYQEAKRKHAPTAEQKKESAERRRAISQDIDPKAIRQHCRL